MTQDHGAASGRQRTVLIVGALISILLIAGAVIVFAGLPSGDAAAPAETPSPPADESSPDPGAVAVLEERLESGEAAELAIALDLDPAEIDAAILEGFADADIDYDLAEAEPVDGGWYIPTTVTDAEGQVSTWTSAIAESEEGLVLVDTVEAGQ